MTNSQARTIIRNAAAERDCKYRITQAGEVHFYGQMPNSIESGWWLFAQSVEDAVKRIAE